MDEEQETSSDARKDLMVRFLTAGESHGQGLVIIVEGVPAGLSIGGEYIAAQLARRQRGYGRGGRMLIEQDHARIMSGVRHGLTLGSPIGMTIENKDWVNWQEPMSVEPVEAEVKRVTRLRQVFDKGNDFCQKITYKTTGVKPEDLLTSFRNSYNPRIVVTVDMIATGTDIKPVEVVFFMRNVRSRSFFEQMKGRGVRTISATDFNAVTPDARNKDRFVIVDAVGVTETELSDSYSLDRKPTVPFDKLLDLVSMGDRDPEVLSSLASRLARLDRHLTLRDREAIEDASHGLPLQTLVSGLVNAADPDAALDAARQATGQDDPPEPAVAEAWKRLLEDAAKPFATNPDLRQRLVDIHRSYEQTIDTVSADSLIEAGFSDEQARATVGSFRQYIEENRDEITALQALYERPYRQRLTYAESRPWPTPWYRRRAPGRPSGCGRPIGSWTGQRCAAQGSGPWPTSCP